MCETRAKRRADRLLLGDTFGDAPPMLRAGYVSRGAARRGRAAARSVGQRDALSIAFASAPRRHGFAPARADVRRWLASGPLASGYMLLDPGSR